MSPRKLSGLATVQQLYVTHVELGTLLDAGLRSKEDLAQAKEKLREFSSLLRSADWRYMGGEDVLQSMTTVRDRAAERIKRGIVKGMRTPTPLPSPTRGRVSSIKQRTADRAKSNAKKPMRAAAKPAASKKKAKPAKKAKAKKAAPKKKATKKAAGKKKRK